MSDMSELRAMAQSPDPETRGMVATALGTVPGDEAFSILVDMLSDSDDRVRVSAINSLGEIKDMNAFEPLLPLLEEESVEIRCATIASLAQLADGRAFAPVVTRLFDVNDDIRKNAAAAVGCLRDPRALEPLLMCLDDSVEWVRANSAWSLGQIGCLEAVDKLRDLADSQDTETVRANAVTAIGNLALKAHGADREEALDAMEFVLTVLDDTAEEPKVRVAAILVISQSYPEVRAMSEEDAAAGFSMIFSLAQNAEDDDIRSTAIWALGKICAKEHASELGFSKQGIKFVIEVLTDAQNDEYEWCRRYAADALAEVTGEAD